LTYRQRNRRRKKGAPTPDSTPKSSGPYDKSSGVGLKKPAVSKKISSSKNELPYIDDELDVIRTAFRQSGRPTEPVVTVANIHTEAILSQKQFLVPKVDAAFDKSVDDVYTDLIDIRVVNESLGGASVPRGPNGGHAVFKGYV